MKCFKCEKGKMGNKLAYMTAHVRGELVPVQTETMGCNRCGFQVLTDDQSAVYTIASADAYREKHGLLTTKELKEIRAGLRMSFRQFAKYLKISEASPKRWEAGLVQDEAMDELIRVKADFHLARENVKQLEARLGVAGSVPQAQVILIQMPRRDAAESEWQVQVGSTTVSGSRFAAGFQKDSCYFA
jgi:putative zinc finger/helix-turn-helix YgiT family protein